MFIIWNCTLEPDHNSRPRRPFKYLLGTKKQQLDFAERDKVAFSLKNRKEKGEKTKRIMEYPVSGPRKKKQQDMQRHAQAVWLINKTKQNKYVIGMNYNLQTTHMP